MEGIKEILARISKCKRNTKQNLKKNIRITFSEGPYVSKTLITHHRVRIAPWFLPNVRWTTAILRQ